MSRRDNLLEYMNSHSSKNYKIEDIKAISVAIAREYRERRLENELKGINKHLRSVKDKDKLNLRIAAIANDISKGKLIINKEDVLRFKKCSAEEYQDRTGRCAWGFECVRKKLGYDPKTGIEIED